MTPTNCSKQITIIIGTQWGDEGKGKITDYLAANFDYVVRFQGGNNAGHTVILDDAVYKFHLVPSGALHPRPIAVIASGVLIDPLVLQEELVQLKKRGLKLKLKISKQAHVIMPYHVALDAALANHQGDLGAGSTKRGIAPVAADKFYRQGIRLGDLLEPNLFKEKLTKAYDFNTKILAQVFKQPFRQSLRQIYRQYLKAAQKLKPYITDIELELYQAYQKGKKILLEGAQGMSLDPDHGVYPHTTSTNNVAPYAGVGTGLGLNCRKRIIGVVKAYVSRVGISPFPSELETKQAQLLRDKGNEYGTTTGRPRRVGWLDLVQVRQSIRTSDLTELNLTKLDVLGGFRQIKICTGYQINQRQAKEMPTSLTEYRKAKPIYETLDGWRELSETEINQLVKQGYPALPRPIKRYIKFIEKQVKCPVSLISLGPQRQQTIITGTK